MDLLEHDWSPGDPWHLWTPMDGRLRLRSVEACEREAWSLLTWPRKGLDPETGVFEPEAGQPGVRPFMCGSWRCRRCAMWRGAVDWARCSAGVRARTWWLYCVLTFDPAAFPDQWAAFRAAGECWDHSLREALRNELGCSPEYLQTWERHRNGFPHVNLVMTGEALRRRVEAGGIVERQHKGQGGRERTCLLPQEFRGWLRDAAVRAGFGPVLWVEVLQPGQGDGMAGYLIKLARELTGAACKKGDQSPLMAPKGFRRIRASRGLLPPGPGVREEGPTTGTLTTVRSAQEPHPRRRTRQRQSSEPRPWDAVLSALEDQARREAEAWQRA